MGRSAKLGLKMHGGQEPEFRMSVFCWEDENVLSFFWSTNMTACSAAMGSRIESLWSSVTRMACLGIWLVLSAFFTPSIQQESAQVDLGYQIHEGYLNVSLLSRVTIP
jgi:hypothetical protein